MVVQDLPEVGLGTWQLTDQEELAQAIKAAWETGYRHIDTAQLYNNEYDIGTILQELAVPREELFVTTKIAPQNYQKHVKASVEESLRRLQTEYLDLVLLHAELSEDLNLRAYQDLLALQEAGVIRHVGVSNFSIEALQFLEAQTGKKPYCNQIVCSPTTRPVELEEFCKEQDIRLTGYSILKPYFNPNPFYPDSELSEEEKRRLDELCDTYQVSIGQLLNKWALQHGYHVIPKSSKAERVKENLRLDFTIKEQDLAEIDDMNRFSAAAYKESVKKMKDSVTEEALETGLLYEKHYERNE